MNNNSAKKTITLGTLMRRRKDRRRGRQIGQVHCTGIIYSEISQIYNKISNDKILINYENKKNLMHKNKYVQCKTNEQC